MNLSKLKNSLLLSSRVTKTIIVSSVDYLIFLFSIYLVIYFEVFLDLPISTMTFKPFLFSAIAVCILFLLGVYRSLVRFINFTAIIELIRSLFLIFLLHSFVFIFFEDYSDLLVEFNSYKDIVLYWLISAVLIIGIRIIANLFFSEELSSSKVIIYGAGSAGIQLASALRYSVELTPIAFVDNDKSLNNTLISFSFSLDIFFPFVQKLDFLFKEQLATNNINTKVLKNHFKKSVAYNMLESR